MLIRIHLTRKLEIEPAKEMPKQMKTKPKPKTSKTN
jgi:hypothetical protein